MDLATEALLAGVVVPAGAAAAVLSAAAHWQRRGQERRAHAVATTALGLGWLAGYACFSWAPWGQDDAWQALPWLVLLATLAGAARLFLPSLAAGLATALVAAATAGVLVPAWDDLRDTRAAWVIALGLTILLLWRTLDWLATSLPARGLGISLLTVMLAGAVVLECSGSAKFAQLAGLGAAAFLPFAVLAFWPQFTGLLRGAIPVYAVLLPGLLFTGYFYSFSDVPSYSYFLTAAAPLALSLLMTSWLYARAQTRPIVTCMLVTLLPLVIAVRLALLS